MKPLQNSDRFLSQAENAGRQIIRSYCDYGIHESNFMEPECFPGILSEVAAGTLDAIANHGCKDFADVFAHFTGCEQGIIDELIEANQGNSPHPEACGKLLEILRHYHKERRKDNLAGKLKIALERGDPTDEILREFAALESEDSTKGKPGLRERAYALRFNPDETPPPDETCMVIGDVPIAARGNLTVPQGKSKVGKSALISAILGAAHRGEYQAAGDTLCVEWHGKATGAIVHLDTEQSRADWHSLVCRGITRSGMPDVSPRLVSLPLVMFSRSERLAILRDTLEHEQREKGRIDLVMLDGVADLCVSPNDEGEALELVSRLHALAQEFDCPIFCVLHENPGSDIGKTRGHLGSELNRKAFANLRIDKDAETSVSTIYGSDMRKRDIPRDQGFCFAWDDEVGMHTFQGRAAGLKAAQRESEAISKARAEWQPIFDFAAENSSQRENCPIPALTPKEAAEIERETSGNEKLTKPDTMKKRMQKAESLGVLKKTDSLHWTITHSGNSGKTRENENHSRP